MPNLLSSLATTSAAATVLDILFNSAIRGVVVLAITFVAVLSLRRSSAAVRHTLWTVGLASVLCLPALALVVPKWRVLPAWMGAGPVAHATGMELVPNERPKPQSIATPIHAISTVEGTHQYQASRPQIPRTDSLSSVPQPPVRRSSSTAESSSALSPPWLAWSVGIWAGGWMLLLLRVGLSRGLLGRVIASGRLIEEGPMWETLHAIRRRLAVSRRVRLYLSDRRALPMTFGVFRVNLLLPVEARQWSESRLEAVLLHELAHVKRHDTVTHVLNQVASAVYWFNPLVWAAAWQARVERERACDDLVVACGVKPSDYAEHLLQIVSGFRQRRTIPCSAVAMARPSRLEGRLLAILHEHRNRETVTRRLLMEVLLAGAAGTVAVAMVQASEIQGISIERFGKTIELIVSDDTGETPLVDFDQGRVGTIVPELREGQDEAAFLQWMMKNGFDAIGETGSNTRGLIGFDMIARYRGDDEWNAPPALVKQRLAIGDPGSPIVMNAHKVPATYFIRTGQGGTGILQIVGFEDRPKGVRIRFKMLRRGSEFASGEADTLESRGTDGAASDPLHSPAESAVAEQTAGSSPTNRLFVRLVASPDGEMTFEGRETTWQELPSALEAVPHRAQTVLEFAISSDELSVGRLNDVRLRTAALAREHGFEYASYIGVHPLGSKGSQEVAREDTADSSAESPQEPTDQDVIDKFNNAVRSVNWPLEHAGGPVVLAAPARERFDSVAELADLTATEASVLDNLLRSRSFDGLDALKAYDPTEFTGNSATLLRAIEKVIELGKRQTNALNQIDEELQSESLSELQRESLHLWQRLINQQHAASVLSIRQVFQPIPVSGKRANWSALGKRALTGGDDHFMALARTPVGDDFPVRFEGEDSERFRVRLISGDDEELTATVTFQSMDVPGERILEAIRMVRDQPVEIDVNGDHFSLLYPSMYIARSGPSTTDLAQIIVTYRPENEPQIDASANEPSNID